MTAALVVNVASFAALGVLALRGGQWRLGVASLLLSIVQAVIYSGRMA